jgi:hypothetical protein
VENRNWKLENGNWKMENGESTPVNGKLEPGIQRVETVTLPGFMLVNAISIPTSRVGFTGSQFLSSSFQSPISIFQFPFSSFQFPISNFFSSLKQWLLF